MCTIWKLIGAREMKWWWLNLCVVFSWTKANVCSNVKFMRVVVAKTNARMTKERYWESLQLVICLVVGGRITRVSSNLATAAAKSPNIEPIPRMSLLTWARLVSVRQVPEVSEALRPRPAPDGGCGLTSVTSMTSIAGGQLTVTRVMTGLGTWNGVWCWYDPMIGRHMMPDIIMDRDISEGSDNGLTPDPLRCWWGWRLSRECDRGISSWGPDMVTWSPGTSDVTLILTPCWWWWSVWWGCQGINPAQSLSTLEPIHWLGPAQCPVWPGNKREDIILQEWVAGKTRK